MELLRDIFPSHQDVGLKFGDFKEGLPLCIFNILNNELGIAIERNMDEWLYNNYNLIKVYHNGNQFEYYGLRLAQYLCINSANAPYCLYLHTKGAVNNKPLQVFVRREWEEQFTKHKEKYISLVGKDKPVVAAPFVGENNETWFNGFYANAQAWKTIPTIEEYNDRFRYEKLWKDDKTTEMIGVIQSRCSGEEACRYLSDKWLPKILKDV